MKRVTVFLPSLAGGGAERSIVTVANGLAARGCTVDLVAARMRGEFVQAVSTGVNKVDLGKKSVIAAVPALARHLRQTNPDSVLAAMSHANIAAMWAHKLSGCRSRIVLSERSHLSSMTQIDQGLIQTITRMLVKQVYPGADCVIAVSEGVASDLRNYVGDAVPVTAIYNPVVDEALIKQSREPVTHPWLLDKKIPVVLAAGRLSTQKGYDTLLRAFAILRTARAARLIILGEGSMRERLTAMAKDLGIDNDVSLPGFSSNPFSAMASCDLFVLSSRYEGLPGVLIQAMACGAPVLSTDCPSGPMEILEGGRWGDLVAVGDHVAIASAMARSLDMQSRQKPDVASRAAAFSVPAAIDAYAKVLGL